MEKSFDQTYAARSRFFQILGAAGKMLADAYTQADLENQQDIGRLIFEAMSHSLVEHHGYTRDEIRGDMSAASKALADEFAGRVK